MSQVHTIGPEASGSRVFKFIAFLYGMASYLIFFVTILYAIGFVMGLVVPKNIDTGANSSVIAGRHHQRTPDGAVCRTTQCDGAAALQGMVDAVRPQAGRAQHLRAGGEFCLLLLFWQWRPIPATVWQVEDPARSPCVDRIAVARRLGAGVHQHVPHQPLRAVRVAQVANHLVDRQAEAPRFRTPLLYKFVRHPIYLGFIIAFWAAPDMSAGHLLFAAVTTGYILLGIYLEERDLIEMFGDQYREYKQRVSMLIPWRKSN